MKLFPYILARYGGISFSTLKYLQIEGLRQEVEVILALKKEEETLRQAIHKELTYLANSTKDYPLKVRLKQIRADLDKGRTVKYPLPSIQELNLLIQERKERIAGLQPIFQNRLIEIREQFKLVGKNDQLWKGILLSSPVLWEKT